MAEAAAMAQDDHHYTSTGIPTWKVGFWTFIGSECLFFGTLLSTYMVYKGQSVVGPFTGDLFDIPLTTLSTFVLLMSSFLMVLALHAIRQNDLPKFRLWTAGVAFFGAIYSRVIRQEARHLATAFGPAYEEYARHVPLFVPRVRGWSGTAERAPQAFSLDRWRRNREYEALLGALAGFAGLALRMVFG